MAKEKPGLHRPDRSNDKTIVITITVPQSAVIAISTDKVDRERAANIKLGEEF